MRGDKCGVAMWGSPLHAVTSIGEYRNCLQPVIGQNRGRWEKEGGVRRCWERTSQNLAGKPQARGNTQINRNGLN